MGAWTSSHVGRPASRLFECYLDEWHDAPGVLLKLQLRAGADDTEEYRAKVYDLPPSSSICPLCNDEVVQSVDHLIHHCSHIADAKSSLLSSVSVALVPASTAYQNFFCGSDSVKTRILLGAPSDDPSADRRIDIAFRRFIVRVHSLRRRHIQASYIVS